MEGLRSCGAHPRRRQRPAASLLAAALVALLVPLPAAAQVPTDEATWAAIAGPTSGPARVVGGYSNGCIAGAQAIPLTGPGHVVIRPQRNRYWGHPDLVRFADWLSNAAAEAGLATLMIGDLGQPRGGPITGHVSHEVGLDIDIWLRLLPGQDRLSPEQIAAPGEISHVTADGLDVDRTLWTPAHVELYRMAATYPGVERIIAHPAIKQALCRDATGDRRWLARVRPWYGHTGHMHIRLACPADSPACVPQAPPPGGEGCGSELAWWFTDGPHRDRGGGGGGGPPPMPNACAAVLGGD